MCQEAYQILLKQLHKTHEPEYPGDTQYLLYACEHFALVASVQGACASHAVLLEDRVHKGCDVQQH